MTTELIHGLTDGEIKHLLELEISMAKGHNSNSCAYVSRFLLEEALYLITEQQSKIEQLETSNEHYTSLNKNLNNLLKTSKVKAYKEFAEIVYDNFVIPKEQLERLLIKEVESIK